MTGIINLMHRQWPSTPLEALKNIKTNICSIGKVFRVVTSTTLGVGGAVLLSHCTRSPINMKMGIGCFWYDFQRTNSTLVTPNSTLLTSNSTLGTSDAIACPSTWQEFQGLEKGCLLGGVVYGMASLLVLVQFASNIMTCCRKKERYPNDNCCSFRYNNDHSSQISTYFPRYIGGTMGVAYGLVFLPLNVFSTGVRDISSVGGVSVTAYLIDAGLGMWDLCCEDLDKKRKDNQKMVVFLDTRAKTVLMLKGSEELGEEAQERIQEFSGGSGGSGLEEVLVGHLDSDEENSPKGACGGPDDS